MIESRITFYRIKTCGFCEYGTEAVAFGDIASVLDDVQERYHQVPLKYSCPYAPVVDTGVLRTFLFDVKYNSASNSWMLVTWNETKTFEGGIASVPGDNVVGSMNVSLTPPPNGEIPGYPSYFWVLPDANLYATVVLDKSPLNGNQGLQKFIKKFMENFSSYALVENLEGGDAPVENTFSGHRVVGYEDVLNGLHEEGTRYVPHFEAVLKRNPGQLEFIRQNVGLINKTVRRCGADYTTFQRPNLFREILLDLCGEAVREDDPTGYKVDYEMQITPTSEELDKIINSWVDRHNESREDRVGFKLSGNSETWWIDSSLAREDFDLDVSEFENGFPITESLLEHLVVRRNEIFTVTGAGS